jgi:hypothetical protein
MLWDKQDEKKLNMINYRSQGLTKKICKTHAIVLAKRINCRVRSEKDSGWIWW